MNVIISEEREYLYHIDVVTLHGVSGWIADKEGKESPSIMAIVGDNEVSTIANSPRPDLVGNVREDGACGFALVFPETKSFRVEELRIHINDAYSEELTLTVKNGLQKKIENRKSLPPEERYIIHFDFISFGTISGWAIDTTSYDPVEIRLLMENGNEYKCITDRVREDLVKAGITRQPAGFTLDTNATCKEQLILSKVMIDGKFSANTQEKFRTAVQNSTNFNIDSDIRGYIDSISPTQINGWVLRKSFSEKLEVSILLDGKILGAASALNYREDLEHAGIEDPSSGFNISFCTQLTYQQFKKIELYINGIKSEFFTELFMGNIENNEILFKEFEILRLQKELVVAKDSAAQSQRLNNFLDEIDVKIEDEKSGSNLLRKIQELSDAERLRSIVDTNLVDYEKKKQNFEAHCKAILSRDLSRYDTLIEFEDQPAPLISIILVLYNKAELTYQCLKSLEAQLDIPFEVIIIDNCSTDSTSDLIKKVKGVKYELNRDNIGFLKACNQARSLVNSPSILLLNNDAIVHAGAFQAAFSKLGEEPTNGVVGAKILHLDGLLQEAGSIIWNDATCLGVGRRDDPNKNKYNFSRTVDYVSGAFFLTSTQIWDELGGFDEALAPCYYEETDFCVRAIEAGYKVVYEPKAQITHFEFGSSSHSNFAVEQMTKNRKVFRKKHSLFLSSQMEPKEENIELAAHRNDKPLLVYVDDQIPFDELGSGFPRARKVITELSKHFNVIVLPMCPNALVGDLDSYSSVNLLDFNPEANAAFLKSIIQKVRCLWISRPHNMQRIVNSPLSFLMEANIPVVYDAEALFSERERKRCELYGLEFDEGIVSEELSLLEGANYIVTVSRQEKLQIEMRTDKPVFKVSHPSNLNAVGKTAGEKREIIIVGNLCHTATVSPNVDSVDYFIDNYMHILVENGIHLRLIGRVDQENRKRWESEFVKVEGAVSSLSEYFKSAICSLAPTRFAAGIPHKVHESLSHGVPVLASELILKQCGMQAIEKFGLLNSENILKVLHNSGYREKILKEQINACMHDMSEEDFKKQIKLISDTINDNSRRESK